MMSFRGGRLRDLQLSLGTVWLATDIAEAKGRQALYTRQSPQVLEALRAMALVESVASSNRIEGVTVRPPIGPPLCAGRWKHRVISAKSKPRHGCGAAWPSMSRDPFFVRGVLRTPRLGASPATRLVSSCPCRSG